MSTRNPAVVPVLVWAEGPVLVVPVQGAVAPPRCVRCNRATHRTTGLTARTGAFGRRRVRVGICWWHKFGTRLVAALLAFAPALLSLLITDAELRTVAVVLSLCSSPVLLVMALIVSHGVQPLSGNQPYFALFRGASPTYLRSLPPPGSHYPGPRPDGLLR